MDKLICQKCGGQISNDFSHTLSFCTICGASLNFMAIEKTVSLTASSTLYSPPPQPNQVGTGQTSRYLIGGLVLLGVLVLSSTGVFFYVIPKFTNRYHCTMQGKPEPKTSDDYVERARDHIEIYSGNGAASLDDCAFAALNEALRLNSDNVEALRIRGYGYKQKKQYELALADYNKTIKLEPESKDNYINRRRLNEDFDKTDLAIEDQTALIGLELKFNSSNQEEIIEAYQKRFFLYLKKSDFDNAITDSTEVIRIKPVGYHYFLRGRAFFEKEDFENALRDFSEAIRLEPKDPDNYLVRAEVYYKMKRNDLGQADAIKGGELRLAKELEDKFNTKVKKIN